MAISNRYSSLARPDLIITEYRFLIHSMQKGHLENFSKSLIAIQRSDQKLWPFRTVLKPGATRRHHHRVSIPHPLHAIGHPENSSKSLIAIQRSDQKLWPFRTVTQAWRDQTSSSPSINSSFSQWKAASRNPVKV